MLTPLLRPERLTRGESGIHALAEEAVEVGFEDVEAGIDHRAVAVAIQFIEEGRGAGRVFRSSRWT